MCNMEAHGRHLMNMTEPSMCGGDAALRQITLTTCFLRLCEIVNVSFLMIDLRLMAQASRRGGSTGTNQRSTVEKKTSSQARFNLHWMLYY